MSTSARHAVASPAAVRWGVGPRAFELRSAEQAVLDRATTVFRPWTPDRFATTASWTIAQSAEGLVVARDGGQFGEPPRVARTGPDRAVLLLEYAAILALTGEPPDVLTFHAALVAVQGRGVMILGPNEAGKSTLAVALWLHGHRLLGDDVAVVEPDSGIARSAPRRVSLRTRSRGLVGDEAWRQLIQAPASEPTSDGYLFHPDEVDGQVRPKSVPLAACVFLARRSAMVRAGTRATRVPEAEAALALVPYSNLVRRLDLGNAIAQIAPLASVVPMYDLPRATLPRMIAAVEQVVAGSA